MENIYLDKKIRRASTVLLGDAGARRTWSIRGIPEENQKRGDEHLSPLR